MLEIFVFIANILNKILYFEIFGVPFLVLWLVFFALFLSFKLYFPNVRFFKHGFDVAIHNKYYSLDDVGDITPRRALFTSISGSVGLGSIAGVGVAITIGGPGAIIWMIITAFFSMNIAFAEATLSQIYRKVENDGKINGGPFRYLRYGLEDIGYKKFGVILSKFFSLMLIFGSIGGGMFQINQLIRTLTSYQTFDNCKIIFGLVFGIFSLYILFRGIKIISKIVAKVVPIMAILYFLCTLIILAINYNQILPSLVIIFKSAFNFHSVLGGFAGAFIIGVRRSIFATEAGLGTASIAHAVAKSKEPIRQAAIACLTPMFIMCFCLMTALIIVITGVYKTDAQGIILTKNAFLTVSDWFPILLTVIIAMIAISNVLGSSFYGQSAWRSLMKNKFTMIYNLIYFFAIVSCSLADLNTIVMIADTFVLSMAIPNLIGIFMLSGLVKKKISRYTKSLKVGDFDKN
ncbi:MAG: amino acid carrier protein [Rickettsiales bacterium]|nr:amino acid carrier protein [Rickettsiales bacterium]